MDKSPSLHEVTTFGYGAKDGAPNLSDWTEHLPDRERERLGNFQKVWLTSKGTVPEDRKVFLWRMGVQCGLVQCCAAES